jgi:hypothetical protein
MNVAMRRRPRIFIAVGLIGWVGCSFLSGNSAVASAAESLSGEVRGLDRAALQKELSLPLEALEKEPTEALRAYVQRLGDLQFALELAVEVSPEERRALSDQILTRVGQVGLLVRQRMTEPRASPKSRSLPASTPGPPPRGDLTGVLLDNSGLLLRLLGGLLIAFALGYLVRGRRAGVPVRSAARRDRRVDPLAPVPVPSEMPGESGSMTLEEIRKAVESGRTVLLQDGCEIRPNRRRHFLTLARETQEILAESEGQTYSVWEDPENPNRFYTLLVCRRLEVLEQLGSGHHPLSKVAEEIQASRVPAGFSLHRAWVEAVSDPRGAPHDAAVAEDSLIR